MDQAAMQEVNLRDDMENTLKIFGHWLKKVSPSPANITKTRRACAPTAAN